MQETCCCWPKYSHAQGSNSAAETGGCSVKTGIEVGRSQSETMQDQVKLLGRRLLGDGEWTAIEPNQVIFFRIRNHHSREEHRQRHSLRITEQHTWLALPEHSTLQQPQLIQSLQYDNRSSMTSGLNTIVNTYQESDVQLPLKLL